MSATETSRQNIGSLFGGKVTSVNYNFQAGPQPSTCTLVIVSENNEFAIPELNELVSVPPFSLQMRVMQTSIKQDSNTKSLQVELIDPISEVLDKELVLIYGEHTDLDYNLNKNPYYLLKSAMIPSTSLPSNVFVNTFLTGSPNTDKFTIKNFGDGINVIGFSRVSYKEKRPVDLGRSLDDFTGHYWITYDGKQINKNLTNWTHNFPELVKFTDQGIGKLDLKFGYCLRNLKDLMLSKGISFDDSSLRFLEDENLLFTTTGSIRNAFSSSLAKIGKSFYVDPFTQKIHIVTSADVNNINTNLSAKYSQFENTEAAQQVSLTKSLNGVTATHFVAKGDLNNEKPDKPEEEDPRPRKQVFNRLSPEKYVENVISKEGLKLFKRVAAIVSEVEDDHTLDKYIFSIPVVSDFPTSGWGKLYGQTEYDFRPINVLTKKQGFFIQDLQQETDFNFGDFDIEEAEEAVVLMAKTGGKSAKTASEHGYLTNVRNLSSLYAGVYFSKGMTERQSMSRDYSNSTFSGKKEHTYQIIVKEGKDKLKDISELGFLYSLLKYGKEKGNSTIDYQNLTIEDLAGEASQISTGVDLFESTARSEGINPIFESEKPDEPEGQGTFYAIAIRDVNYSLRSDSERDAKSVIDENLFLYDDGQKTKLVLTKGAKKALKPLIRGAREAYKVSLKGKSEINPKAKRFENTDRLVVRYMPVDPDEDEENEEEAVFEEPSLFALQHLPSKIKNFSERNLGKFNGGYSEVGLFLENNGDINPQFEGPFITTNIKYFRPPIKDDFKISDGVDSVGISISNGGITTSVRYSSRKFAQLDNSITTDIGHQSFVRDYRNAFYRNSQGL